MFDLFSILVNFLFEKNYSRGKYQDFLIFVNFYPRPNSEKPEEQSQYIYIYIYFSK